MDTAATAPPRRALHAFRDGVAAAWTSVFVLVLLGNYVGIGALAYEFGFSLSWMLLSTLLVWAAPAQVILISTLNTATLIEVALAVTLSSVRFLPMVVALLLLQAVAQLIRQTLILRGKLPTTPPAHEEII